MKKILMIPGGFVPYNDTVTLLSYKHLRNCDVTIDVIALRGKEDSSLKKSIENDKNYSKFHVTYVCDYDDAVATLARKNVISGMFNVMRYVLKSFKKGLNKEYGVIYTSSIPAFTHVAGYLIKKIRKEEVVWIASLSDPLKNSPYKHDQETMSEYSLIEKIGFYVYTFLYMGSWYEKICQQYADKVVYICKEQMEFTTNQYPSIENTINKALLIPINYIEEWELYQNLMTMKKNNQNDYFVISHFGRVYGHRKISEFLQAMKEIKELGLSKKIVFKQVGEFIPRINYDEVLTMMSESDCLALFDTILTEDEIQPYLPSKSLEYLLSQKELLIITTSKSPSYRILSELGYTCCRHDVVEIKNRLLTLLSSCEEVHVDYTSFENKVATKELTDYIMKKLQ